VGRRSRFLSTQIGGRAGRSTRTSGFVQPSPRQSTNTKRVRVIFGSGKAWSSGADDVDSFRSMENFSARSKAPSAKAKHALCEDLQRANIVTFGSTGNEL